MKKWIGLLFVMLFMPFLAFAQEAAAPVVEAAQAAVVPPEENLGFLFDQIMKAIGDWKAIGWQAGLAGLLTALIGTMKNSLLRAWLWDRIPHYAKVLVAPVVAIVVFALGMGKDFGWGAFFAALTTGVAAVYLHQLISALKEAPFVGEKLKAVLDFLAKILKKPEAPAK